jgi:hypothetical protein
MIKTLARLGYASKALIYAIVGSLAVAAALNRGGRITDTRGALRVLLTQPLGNTLLWLVAIGLCGYALWRLLDAVFDPDRHGSKSAGWWCASAVSLGDWLTERSDWKPSVSPAGCGHRAAVTRHGRPAYGLRESWICHLGSGSSP